DIMAYSPGTPVPFFSNPNLTFDGAPLGVPASDSLKADNAQTMNRLASVVAKYRTALSRIGFAEGRYTVSEGARSISLPLKRRGDLNTATSVTVVLDSTSSAKEGVDYVRPMVLTIPFATTQETAEFTIEIPADRVPDGTKTLKLSLANVAGNHGLDQVAVAVVMFA